MTPRSVLQNLMVVFTLIGVMGLVGTAGCGVYSASSGRVEEAIQRVSVKVLENRTPEPNLGVELSDAIILALQTIFFTPPTFRKLFSCSTRNNLACKSIGISEISSSRSVPDPANSKSPVFSRSAPVKEPLT